MSDLNLQAALEEASKLAAKLKEERDEARAQAKKLEGAYEDATNYYARWSELIEERDEARGEAVRYRSLYYAQLGIDGSAGRFQWEAKP
jgi:uncharacterized coiled-coil DUF342 family protein